MVTAATTATAAANTNIGLLMSFPLPSVDGEEELRDGEVGQRQLGGEVAPVAGDVRRPGMAGGMGGHPDRGDAHRPGQADQLDRVAELLRRAAGGERIAAQSEQVLQSRV